MKEAILPMVSCLMVTQKSRADLAARAIRCWREQTYPSTELIVVTDDPDGAEIMEPEASVIPAPPGAPLGELRNIALWHAGGAYVAQWDDDDWYHPDRLDRQVIRLEQDLEAGACFLEKLQFAWPAEDIYAESPATLWECSMLARASLVPRYPSLARGEDTPVASSLKPAMLLAPELYVRVIHDRNTWGEAHFSPVRAWPKLGPQVVAEVKQHLGI